MSAVFFTYRWYLRQNSVKHVSFSEKSLNNLAFEIKSTKNLETCFIFLPIYFAEASKSQIVCRCRVIR